MHSGRRITLLTIAALAAVGSVAPAEARRVGPKPALVDQGGQRLSGAPARWLRQSRMPLFRGTLRLIFAACPGRPRFSGCVYVRRPRRIYVAPAARNPRAVAYHEMGHSFDVLVMRARDRRAFKRLAGLHRRGWYTGSPVAPSELFAEAYALCARFGPRRPAASRLGYTRSTYGYRPSRRRHRAACLMITRVGRRARRRAPAPAPGAPPVAEQVPPPDTAAPGAPPEPQPRPLLPGLPVLPLPVG